MKMDRKKALVSRTLKVGNGRILFNKERLDEIKNAITKEDVRDLVKDKAIIIKEIKGVKKKVKVNTRRKDGSIKKKTKNKKKNYMTLTRKLRKYLYELRRNKKIVDKEYYDLRKQIRAKNFRSKSHMKEIVENINKKRRENEK